MCAASHSVLGISVSSAIPNHAGQKLVRHYVANDVALTAAKEACPSVNRTKCIACHKPLDKASYTFTPKELGSASPR